MKSKPIAPIVEWNATSTGSWKCLNAIGTGQLDAEALATGIAQTVPVDVASLCQLTAKAGATAAVNIRLIPVLDVIIARRLDADATDAITALTV